MASTSAVFEWCPFVEQTRLADSQEWVHREEIGEISNCIYRGSQKYLMFSKTSKCKDA